MTDRFSSPTKIETVTDYVCHHVCLVHLTPLSYKHIFGAKVYQTFDHWQYLASSIYRWSRPSILNATRYQGGVKYSSGSWYIPRKCLSHHTWSMIGGPEHKYCCAVDISPARLPYAVALWVTCHDCVCTVAQSWFSTSILHVACI
jgi:hypothetical protein